MVELIGYLETIDPSILVLAIIIIFILQSPLLTFPGWILMVYSGSIFGMWQGSLLNHFGLFISGVLGYIFGYWTSLDIEKMDNKYLTRFKKFLDKYESKAIFFLRAVPILPNNVISIGSGWMKVDSKKYTLYTAIFIYPQSLFWAFIGDSFLSLFIDDLSLEVSYWHLILAAVVFLSLIGLKLYQQYRRIPLKKDANEIDKKIVPND